MMKWAWILIVPAVFFRVGWADPLKQTSAKIYCAGQLDYYKSYCSEEKHHEKSKLDHSVFTHCTHNRLIKSVEIKYEEISNSQSNGLGEHKSCLVVQKSSVRSNHGRVSYEKESREITRDFGGKITTETMTKEAEDKRMRLSFGERRGYLECKYPATGPSKCQRFSSEQRLMGDVSDPTAAALNAIRMGEGEEGFNRAQDAARVPAPLVEPSAAVPEG